MLKLLWNGLISYLKAIALQMWNSKLAQRLVKPDGEAWEEGNWWIFDWLRI
jgi:hypothetical protein